METQRFLSAQACAPLWCVTQQDLTDVSSLKRRRGAHCGVSLRFLKAFVAQFVSGERTGWSTKSVVEEVVKGITQTSQLRLVDMLDESCQGEIGLPEYFVSHAWSR